MCEGFVVIEQYESEIQCGKCHGCFPESMFSVDRKRASGRHPYCSECRKVYQPKAKGTASASWDRFADDVIRQRYPTGGVAACQRMLPTRTDLAILQRASRLGVRKQVRPVVVDGTLYPREVEEAQCDLALTNFRECEPAANLVASLGVLSEVA